MVARVGYVLSVFAVLALRESSIARAEPLKESSGHLSQAAALLDKGDDAAASQHLVLYLEEHPEHTAVRLHLAELLLRQERTYAARVELERFEAEAQEQPAIPLAQRIRCESRLTKIAVEQEDDYREHLHRGIGLYLLARERRQDPDANPELVEESLLFKAASELTFAQTLRPDEARPSWYLFEVWSCLAQRGAARRRLHEAKAAAPFTYLTPSEHRDLLMACQPLR
jgi:hypothetical protein